MSGMDLFAHVLAAVPPVFLARSVRVVLARMERRRPGLFDSLRRLPEAVVHLKPVDGGHVFRAQLGPGAGFALLEESAEKADACVIGSLAALTALLEGRADGDTLFFGREIRIEGSMEPVVALRNALENEDIRIAEEILGLLGPFGKDLRDAAALLGRVRETLRSRAGKAAV